MNKHPKVAHYVAAGVVLLAAALAFGVSAPLDPEPHHDGIQLAPAIAVSEGLWINSEVFDQYGPITAWLQALAVHVLGPTLLSVRILTAAVLTASAVLLYLLARRITSSIFIGVSVSALWILLWPGRSVDSLTNSLLPWPSTTFLLVQLAVALLAVHSVRGGWRRPVSAGWLGLLIGIALLVRTNTGFALVVAVIFGMAVLGTGGRRVNAREWGWFVAGVLLPAIAVFAAMAWHGALGDYLQQTIVGPLAGKGTEGAHTTAFYIKNAYVLGSIPLALVTAVVFLVSRAPRIRNWVVGVIVACGVLGLTIWSASSILGNPLRDLILGRLTWAPALDVQAAQPMYLAALVTLVALAVMLLRLVVRVRQPMAGALHAIPTHLRVMGVLVLLASSSLAQLVPIADPQHLWWAAPLFLLLMVHLLTFRGPKRTKVAMILVLVVPYALVSIPRTLNYLREDRQHITSGVLAGMQVRAYARNGALLVDSVLGGAAPRSSQFFCDDGLFAVWTGQYLSDSPAFVQWSFGVSSVAATDGPPTHQFVCLMPAADGSAPSYQPPPGMSVTRIVGPINISYFNYMYLAELTPE